MIQASDGHTESRGFDACRRHVRGEGEGDISNEYKEKYHSSKILSKFHNQMLYYLKMQFPLQNIDAR